MTDAKPTYTACLLAVMEKKAHKDGVSNKRLRQFQGYVREFAKEWAEKADLEKAARVSKPFDGTLSWGKFKGKSIETLAKNPENHNYLRYVKDSGYASESVRDAILFHLPDEVFSDGE